MGKKRVDHRVRGMLALLPLPSSPCPQPPPSTLFLRSLSPLRPQAIDLIDEAGSRVRLRHIQVRLPCVCALCLETCAGVVKDGWGVMSFERLGGRVCGDAAAEDAARCRGGGVASE